jgi:orotidine-5'-phosphate decarboxylase
MPDGAQFSTGRIPRDLPPDMADRLIVALDVDTANQARRVVKQLDGLVSFFKIGLGLFFQPGVNALIDELVRDKKKVFLDYKMFDIGETVRRGVESAVKRGITFLTVHGDADILSSAVKGRGNSKTLKIFSVSVLTSLDDQDLADMGYSKTVKELIQIRVRNAVNCGCDGIIASPNDSPDELRNLVNDNNLLIATPGIRMLNDSTDDHARAGSPSDAIFNGADYLVVGRPIIREAFPRPKAVEIIEEMKRGQERRLSGAG